MGRRTCRTRYTLRTRTVAPKAEPARTDEAGLWYADGDMVRKAYTLRAEDDDLVRPAPWCVTYSTTRRVRVW